MDFGGRESKADIFCSSVLWRSEWNAVRRSLGIVPGRGQPRQQLRASRRTAAEQRDEHRRQFERAEREGTAEFRAVSICFSASAARNYIGGLESGEDAGESSFPAAE